MKPVILWCIVLLLSSLPAFGQDIKFGKYKPSEFELSEVEFEPDADAVVLEEVNKSFISNYVLISEINRRFKVLSEAGKSIGNVALRYYAKDQIEVIQKLKAQIVNVENGEEKVIKLTKNDFFEVDAGNGWKEIRFTFPEVREGSILEYEYTKRDKSIVFIDGWVFQNGIPTLKSYYSIEIPSNLDYKMLGQGLKVITANYRKHTGYYEWNLTDLKSIKEEPYMNHPMDYLEKVQFQLSGHEYQTQSRIGLETTYKKYFADWQELATFYMDNKFFSTYLKPDRNSLKNMAIFNKKPESKAELVSAIYENVSKTFTFNGKTGISPEQNLKSTLETQSGKRSELNLTLLAYLRAHDIEAYPVLISSKGNGRSQLVTFPFADQFNQLILVINIGDKLVFADATSKLNPLGYLPLAFLVNEGFVLMEKNSGLINVDVNQLSGIYQVVDIKANDEGQVVSETVLRFTGYDALSSGDMDDQDNKDKLKKKIIQVSDDDVLSFDIALKTLNEKLTLESKLINKVAYGEEEITFLHPFQFTRWKENPFTANTRNFPVDFNYTISDRFSAIIQIPEGYELDDYPEDISLTLPDGSLVFNYKTISMDNLMQVNMVLQIKQDFIAAETYPHLKYFMDIVTSKLKEPIVLQKTTLKTTAEER